MQALCWYGKNDVRVETVPDPRLLRPTDVILRVTRTAICGSDLHLLHGAFPGMVAGDILGHEFTGEVVEIGPEVQKLQRGDRVVVPFAVSCGHCDACRHELWAFCDNANPHAALAARFFGEAIGAVYGYSHLMGGYAGGQAQYVRVPYADIGPLKIPAGVSDEQALLLSDIFPTGYMAAENCDLELGDTVAIWGCGPVGQFAIRSALMLGAAKVIAIDRLPERLRMAAAGGAEPLNLDEVDDLLEELRWRTGGRGPDACIDAVGQQAHACRAGFGHDGRAVLRQAITACRKGGTVSIPGVYAGDLNAVPFGAAFAKGLTLRMGPTHIHRYLQPLMQRILQGEIDPAFVITHRFPLAEAPEAYRLFNQKQQDCIKVVLNPWPQQAA